VKLHNISLWPVFNLIGSPAYHDTGHTGSMRREQLGDWEPDKVEKYCTK